MQPDVQRVLQQDLKPMTGDGAKIRDSNQRVCDRLALSRTLLLEFDDGEILMGKSVNISPRGTLMKTDSPPQGKWLGRAGTLYIISDEGRFSIGYPCKVVRLEDGFIAVEIHKNAAAAFGNYITDDLLGR
jgi:hypothetical protein